MNATGKRRLLKLADFLETAELPGEFDLGTLGESITDGQPTCGTTACALGWATTIPSFRRAGLHLSSKGALRCKGMREPIWKDLAARFFSIQPQEARELFGARYGHLSNIGQAARHGVAERIRALIASERKRAA